VNLAEARAEGVGLFVPAPDNRLGVALLEALVGSAERLGAQKAIPWDRATG
jgi:hypothetical protein